MVVTATIDGAPSASVASGFFGPVAKGRIRNKSKPAIAGDLRVGSRLKAQSGSRRPGKVQLHYVWLSNHQTVGNARSYAVRQSDRGHHITLRVTARKLGYQRLIVAKRGGRVT